MPTERRTAAIVTVGSEIVDGVNLDTNTREIATALTGAGYRVVEAVSVADDVVVLSAALKRLVASYELVIATGGLGPTHDDITREAAADALGRPLLESSDLRARLDRIASRHVDPDARAQVYSQALVIEGADIIEPSSGTAAGQVVSTPAGKLALLPGPPHEMRGMLPVVLGPVSSAPIRILSCAGGNESDTQVIAQRVLGDVRGIDLTVLATPANVRVVLVDRGAGEGVLDALTDRIGDALGERCYSRDGRTLAQTVLDLARDRGLHIGLAESCTGGLVSAALTAVPGSSAVFLGSVVSYADQAKEELLGVATASLREHGAVSEETAAQMASGARERLRADIAVSVTGIAGPDGGTPDKPVGLVWFGVSDAEGTLAVSRNLFGDRAGVRERATVTALDLVRRRLAGFEIS